MVTQTTPEADARLAIRASPRGTRAGFVVLNDGAGGCLTITVLPEPWAEKRAQRYLADCHMAGGFSHVTMYETETVEIPTTKSVLADLTESLLELKAPESEGDLVELTRPAGASTLLPVEIDGGFESVVHVMLLAKRQRTAFDGDGFQGFEVASLLRIIAQHLFVAEAGKLIDRARPAYKEIVEVLSSPRGKLNGTSLAFALLTGKPEVESQFDELTTDTPLLRIVLAALRIVATDHVPSIFATTVAPSRDRASALAHRLKSVAAIDSERALLSARRLVLSPLDRQWRTVFDLAVQVLSGKAVLPRVGRVSTPRAAVISIYMEKWWEQCLAEALLLVADRGTIREQQSVVSPWGSTVAGGNADLLFAVDGRVVLADAKYKLDGMALGADDGHQMFSYSHTARHPEGGRLTENGAVFYPTRVGGRTKSRRVGSSVLLRATGPLYELRLFDLPFPSSADVVSDDTWRDYIGALAAGIRRGLSESTFVADS